MNDFNQQIITQFRANAGRVGGDFEGAALLLLHHRGARTGIERVTPLMYRDEADAWVVFASKAGAPTDPDWYHNLRANPEATIEEGSGELGVYSPWSWWPLIVAGGAAIGFLAMALGWWLMVIGAVVAIIGLVGWIFEFSRGQHAH